MLSLQEMLMKTEEARKEVKEHLNSREFFHPLDCSVLNELKGADKQAVAETLKAVPLERLIKEFLGNGVGGAAYLIPDKIYDILFEAGAMNDIVPNVSNIVTCPGSSLKVDVEIDDSFKAHYVGSGPGESPIETIKLTQVTITPSQFNISPAITYELIEDSQFDMFATHLRRAAQQMGQFSSEMFLKDLITCSDGDGTQNTHSTATADRTYLGDLAEAWNENAQDKHISDRFICGPEVVTDILQDATVSAYGQRFHDRAITASPLDWGNFLGMGINMVLMNESYTGDGALYISSKWHSFALRRETAMLTVRKRWLRIENYSNPIEDLVGAVISSRQDQASVYNDASCEITESS
jgi:hypothetical protein